LTFSKLCNNIYFFENKSTKFSHLNFVVLHIGIRIGSYPKLKVMEPGILTDPI
jgi:hypothetical protein